MVPSWVSAHSAGLYSPIPRNPESCVQGNSNVLFSSASLLGAKHPGLLERGGLWGHRVTAGSHHCMCEAVRRALWLDWGWLRALWATWQSSECLSKGPSLGGREKTATHTGRPLLKEDSKKATFHGHHSWACGPLRAVWKMDRCLFSTMDSGCPGSDPTSRWC